ncbi:hypothetical protein JCM8547_008362 [Rhodosporidiobolus lusitaniae]
MSSHAAPPPPRLTLAPSSFPPAFDPSSSLSSAPTTPPLSTSQQQSSLPTSASKNSLFDLDWRAVAPSSPSNRSRSSTTESRFSLGGGESDSGRSTGSKRSRKSWMDIDADGDSPPLSAAFSSSAPAMEKTDSQGKGKATMGLRPLGMLSVETDRTPRLADAVQLPDQGRANEFPWPLTPPSPYFPSTSSPFTYTLPTVAPPLPPPVSHLTPASPPRPRLPARTSTVMPSSPPSVSSFSSSFAPPSAGQSSNPLLDTGQSPLLRLSPTSPYLIGEGRHASVYVASFRPPTATSVAKGGSVRAEKASRRRQLCAAKRLAPDRENQVSGLGEAFILAKLYAPLPPSSPSLAGERHEERPGGSKYILRLFGVRDERDGLEAPLALPGLADGLSRNGSLRSVRGLRRSLRESELGGSGLTSPLKQTFDEEVGGAGELAGMGKSSREPPTRARPDTAGEAGGGGKAATGRLSLLSRALEPPLASSRTARRPTSSQQLQQAQTTPSSPVSSRFPPSASIHSSSTSSPSQSSPSSTNPSQPQPRIDLMLEYCLLGHSLSFVRSHPELMSKERWLGWAAGLAEAVAWCHEKGVLHADVKPQNVMIAPDLTPRLSDFGSSLFLPPPSSPSPLLPTDPHGLGTPSYSPPEFVRPLPSPFSYPSDIFSLGVTLGVWLNGGREPYEGMRSVERMVRVAGGGWYAWEEGRRVREELEGREEWDELEEGLSRQGSVRSTRSGRSSVRGLGGGGGRARESSVESVRSFVSTREGEFAEVGVGMEAYDKREVLRSLLVDEEDGEEEEGDEVEVEKQIDTALSSLDLRSQPSTSAHPTHTHSRIPSSPSTLSSPFSPTSTTSFSSSQLELPPSRPPTRFYPGTTTPLQYFPSRPSPPSSAAEEDDPHVVPVGVRVLIERMTRPVERERPNAKEVREEMEALRREAAGK